ncbi:transport permease protein [Luteimicrobium album]|uniref:Transport permease protein n=1 Tax=Luteimicrobium album TaxID=1054550 RepID=A0ABQ6I4A9_9MICO|nr:ABC transporter permease [Luteimicrobium album]GMA25096.1 transport permease protein [Luteimicrobium album]
MTVPTQRKAPAPAASATTGAVPAPVTPSLTSDQLRHLAETHGLKQMGVRPPLREYVRNLWARRQFTAVLARSKAYARNQTNYLGQLWSLLNPALNALTYVLIFGFILNTTKGVGNHIAFIVLGTFTFRFFDQSVAAGAKSISSNMNLVRSVHFPRAVLPTSSVMSELFTALPATIVMLAFAFGSGFLPDMDSIPITWQWLLLVPAMALLWLFNIGCAFFVARWVAITPDLNNVIPFVMRLLMYGSGVIWTISTHVTNEFWLKILDYQPVAVFLYLVRSCVMDDPTIPQSPARWVWGAIWAVSFIVVGFLLFWRGEERYGRD